MTDPAFKAIRHILTQNHIVLFLKGTPISPLCGFSALAVKILDHYQVPYKAINVLEDEKMRQNIKKFANWPTIPQLYVDGEFIGGSDIMEEMFKEGELEAILKKNASLEKNTSS